MAKMKSRNAKWPQPIPKLFSTRILSIYSFDLLDLIFFTLFIRPNGLNIPLSGSRLPLVEEST